MLLQQPAQGRVPWSRGEQLQLQAVDPVPAIHGRIDEICEFLWPGHISLDGQHTAAEPEKSFLSSFEAFRISAADRDQGRFLNQSLSQRCPEAIRSPGYQNDRSVQVKVHAESITS
jgi:hypothetical protein